MVISFWEIGLSKLLRSRLHRGLSARYCYEEYWLPNDEDEAMKMIIEPYVSWEEFEESGRENAQRIREILPDTAATILDFGCGIGRVLRYLVEYKKLYGVDISRKMLEMARSRLPADNVVLKHVTECAIPLENESVDLVYSLLTLQHIDRADVTKIVGEFHRILKAGGYCYLQFPSYGDGEIGRDTRPWTEQGVRELLRDFSEAYLAKSESSTTTWVNLYVLAQKDEASVEV